MRPEVIRIAEGTTLTLRLTRLGVHPPDQEQALSALSPARADFVVMQRLRLLVPHPASTMSDDQVLQAVATMVSHGLMVLHVRSPLCTADKKRFFDWLSDALSDMADDLSTTPQLMLTLAVKEGGWNKPALDHNQPLNNPFGMNLIRKGQAAGNIGYATLAEAVASWKRSHGEQVRGITDARQFVDALLKAHYNTVNPKYGDEFVARYVDVGRAMKACGVD